MNIGIIANLSSPTTDYYRTINPYLALSKTDKSININILNPDTVKWYDFYSNDVIVISRPNGETILGFIAEAKKMGKKVIIDHDDLLHEVNDANPASQHFNSDKVKQSVEKAFKYADHVTVSTPFLYDFYSKYIDKDKITIVPNAINLDITPFIKVETDKLNAEKKRVLWRGSSTHLEDLFTVNKFWDYILNNKRAEVALIGLPPWLSKTVYPKAISIPWNNSLFQYFELMANSKPHYGVFPLTVDNFNQSKSNNFAMEMLVAGCLPYAPSQITEFNFDGVRLYDNQEKLIQMFEKCLNFEDKEYYNDLKKGRDWIRKNRDLEKVNLLRKEILNNL